MNVCPSYGFNSKVDWVTLSGSQSRRKTSLKPWRRQQETIHGVKIVCTDIKSW